MKLLIININKYFDDITKTFNISILKKKGYEVEIITSIEDIKKSLNSNNIVLCNMDSIDIVLDSQADNPHIRIIFAPIKDDINKVNKYLDKEISALICKPFSHRVLLFELTKMAHINDLEKNNRSLRIDNKHKEHFIHTAFHDLKTPLFILEGYLDSLNMVEDLDDFSKDCLSRAKKASERLERMISDLFKLSEFGKIEYKQEEVNMGEIAHIAVDELQLLIKSSDMELSILDNGKDWPVIVGDKVQIIKVFVNLIENAIKYRGEDKLIVEIGYKNDKTDNVIFYVKDNGIGIDSSNFDYIFDVFARLKEKESIKGTGLGLTIVKRIIAEHVGEIWVESDKGIGSVFYFSLPKF